VSYADRHCTVVRVNEASWKVELTTWSLEYIYLLEVPNMMAYDPLSVDDGTKLHVKMFQCGPQTSFLPSIWFEMYGFWITV